MKLYESEYKTSSFEKENSLLITRWKSHSFRLTEELFKAEILTWLSEVKKYKPLRLLIDTTDFQFVLVPEVQDWFDQEVFTVYPEAGVKKKAFLVATDFISQVSLEQHTEDVENNTFEVGFYDSEEDAIKWLKS